MKIGSHLTAILLHQVRGRLCTRCGKPASCAVMDGGAQPACIDCGLVVQKLGYAVVFPERKSS